MNALEPFAHLLQSAAMPALRRAAIEITDRAAWHALRQRDLTASRIAALFDKHPFLTRDGLAAQLRGEAKRFDNIHMRAGRILEPGVAVAISEVRPKWKLTKATSYHRLPDHRIGATPDYWLDDDGLIQIGTVAEWNGKPPLYKIIQTITEMLVTGKTHGYCAIMVKSLPALPLHIFEVTLSPEAARCIFDGAAAWWAAWGAGKIADKAIWEQGQ